MATRKGMIGVSKKKVVKPVKPITSPMNDMLKPYNDITGVYKKTKSKSSGSVGKVKKSTIGTIGGITQLPPVIRNTTAYIKPKKNLKKNQKQLW